MGFLQALAKTSHIKKYTENDYLSGRLDGKNVIMLEMHWNSRGGHSNIFFNNIEDLNEYLELTEFLFKWYNRSDINNKIVGIESDYD